MVFPTTTDVQAMRPSPAPFLVSVSERGNQDRLDRMHTVFRLLKGKVVVRLEYVVRDLETIADAIRISDLFAQHGFGIVERGQTVHELHVRTAASLHELRVHLIRQQQVDALLPYLFGLAHRHPYIGVDEINALDRLLGIFSQSEFASVSLLELPRNYDE